MEKPAWAKEQHAILADFVKATEEESSDMAMSVTSVIAQFLTNLKINFHGKADSKRYITRRDLINAQIEELNRCIVELSAFLYNEKLQEILDVKEPLE